MQKVEVNGFELLRIAKNFDITRPMNGKGYVLRKCSQLSYMISIEFYGFDKCESQTGC